MEIYLPIAELSANALILLALGGGVGLLSGMFGVGGGFLMTPLLFFLGVTPSVAVGTGTNLIIASSVSGTMAHWRRGNVDFLVGGLISAGGAGGAWLGAFIFKLLSDAGQIDLVVSLSYVVFLTVVGCLMGVESVRATVRRQRTARRKAHVHTWIHGLRSECASAARGSTAARSRRSRSASSMGIVASIMGVGGGFFMVPAMIYLIGMPTARWWSAPRCSASS